MSRLLLDTTFLIDAERSDQELAKLISDEDETAVAAITVAELLVGVELASTGRREARQSFVNALVDSIGVLDYDLKVAAAHAALLAHVRTSGRPRGAHDLIIAATARANNRTIISADRSAFSDLPGVAVLNHR